MTVQIEMERLILREFVDDDLDNLYALVSDPVVMRYCAGALDRAQAQVWLTAAQRYYARYGYDYWAAVDKYSGAFVGQIGILRQEIEGLSCDCIAYMICREQWGKGYATEGAAGCIRYGFETLQREQLYATVEAENLASQSVLVRCGMQYKKDVCYLGKIVRLYVIAAR